MVTMRFADVRKQQPQVLVNLGSGSDGRARIVAAKVLLDGNGGRKAFNVIDVRLLQLLEKIAGVGREAFHVFALAFGVNRVKSETGLARATQPCDHNELLTGKSQVYVLEVVLARPRYNDRVLGHG